jgi:hypothetical protein
MYGILYNKIIGFKSAFARIAREVQVMLPAQKQSWYFLAVLGMTAAVVLALLPFLGYGATGGFGLLGLMGLGPLFFRRKEGRVVTDERDWHIQRRAVLIAYAVFWLAFVAAGVLVPFIYPESVPSRLVSTGVWVAFMLFMGVLSVATLVLYAREG